MHEDTDDIPADCPFCASIRHMHPTGAGAVSIPDAYPVSPGHTLVLPVRHVADFFDLDEAEQAQVWLEVTQVRERLARTHAPAGFNVGLNAGAAAGQTVPHAHVHVIPRYVGDVDDPRGGVRWVLPEHAAWWSSQ